MNNEEDSKKIISMAEGYTALRCGLEQGRNYLLTCEPVRPIVKPIKNLSSAVAVRDKDISELVFMSAQLSYVAACFGPSFSTAAEHLLRHSHEYFTVGALYSFLSDHPYDPRKALLKVPDTKQERFFIKAQLAASKLRSASRPVVEILGAVRYNLRVMAGAYSPDKQAFIHATAEQYLETALGFSKLERFRFTF